MSPPSISCVGWIVPDLSQAYKEKKGHENF